MFSFFCQHKYTLESQSNSFVDGNNFLGQHRLSVRWKRYEAASVTQNTLTPFFLSPSYFPPSSLKSKQSGGKQEPAKSYIH